MIITSFPDTYATYAKEAIPVQASRVDQDTPVQVEWQDEPLTAYAGDMIVTDGKASWPVGAGIFERSYRANEDGSYTKVATIDAVCMDEPFTILTREGRADGQPGDWLARGVDGEIWPVPAASFEATYRPTGQDHAPEPSIEGQSSSIDR